MEATEVAAEPERKAKQERRAEQEGVAEQVRLATVEETSTAHPRRAGHARRRSGRADSRVPLMGTRTCNALLSALVALGELSSATRVLQAMDAGAAEPPNAYTLCIMMRAHGGRVDMRRAEDLWQRLETQGWIDTVGLNTWLQVCLSAGSPARALQAFQRAKVDLPALRFDTVTFGTLINGLTRLDTRDSTQRALQLWGEMRQLRLPPDDAIVSALLAATIRHLGAQSALRLRADVLSLGWPAAQLQRHNAALLAALPSTSEVVADLPKWRALGVRPASTLASEQAELISPSEQLALADNGGEPDDDEQLDDDDVRWTTTASDEIFERHGWNQMGSSWRAF